MHMPVTVQLSPELETIRKRWAQAERSEREIIYSREFAPSFAPLFAALPLDGSESDRPRFRALVSVLGFSWQPVALMAAWANPEAILVIGTEGSMSVSLGGESVREIIPRVSGIPRDRFAFQTVPEADELSIYREVRSFLGTRGIGCHEAAVDPTGGKKSMSVSAALAGFLSGSWIVYVDYGSYNSEKRIPEAGSEYPRLLKNPLEVFGELDITHIKEAFRRGNYEEASHLASNLASRLYEPREAEALSLLGATYAAWHRFDFENAAKMLLELQSQLNRFAVLGKWTWSSSILEKAQIQTTVLENLANLTSKLERGSKPQTLEEGMPLVLNHLAAAERRLSFHEVGVAILLVYAALERYVDLCLWVMHGLNDDKPDYSRIPIDIEDFHRKGRDFHKKQYQRRDFPNKISLAFGAQLLATLNPELMPTKSFGPIQGLMSDRNKCEFEHGLHAKILKRDDVVKHLGMVKEIVGRTLVSQGEEIEARLAPYRFPSL